ncbi:putative phosphatidate cytidylyltransferase [Encephalitozoon hellem ATCC 50504]|uniref:Phosphatidate cytidylyltransferase n=1 Tax=Encephalitozoon hellem TaxID=27973 RepID=A0A9Q9C639_ENCHE|nr:putative phosphatidate cytidylyltransferase [Encephalitozoon hellem ATCC 50504]AFM98346.1 putative phosphatidate cytidylyltransferase [Encephalitozoon hellem ATCC 50504]UTX43227.1 phosphatidate cytidylyltransferase [Encephalitozoon hellem]WEL38684.1 phosphatidate cytidylyltransferase [Encephalitozoon hellem]|eukprot:XP_003887327.1 putative phosphatidate cytidylyltransferase [Encephalitozoon hellem ATCC 50504]
MVGEKKGSKENLNTCECSKTLRRKEERIQNGPIHQETVQGKMEGITKTNFFKRLVLSIVMISGFFWICVNNKIYSFVLVIFLTISIIKEMIGITRKSDGRSFHLRISIILGFSVPIYLYLVFPSIMMMYFSEILRCFFRRLSFMCFYTYVVAFMSFVGSLRKGKLRSQLGLFALVNLSTYSMAMVAKCAIFNLNKGRFWFVFPALLVISNDISAYVVGKSIGKRPLYHLSPKKTLEGFIGAFIFTAIVGFILGYLHVNQGFLRDGEPLQFRKPMKLKAFNTVFKVPAIYFHIIPFILVASFVAPFSGFLASALKRAYKKKDFGESISGHGGIADRMDCQVIIAIFTSTYINSFIYTEDKSVGSVFSFICRNFSPDEITILIEMLNRRISSIRNK